MGIKSYLIFIVTTVIVFSNCKHTPSNKKNKWPTKAKCLFDKPNNEILTRKGIDSVLNRFKVVKFSQLDSSYKAYSDPKSKFVNKLKGLNYYIIRGEEVFTPIVGKFRINHFLARDKFYYKNLINICSNKEQYWLVDKKMLYMMLDLILTLDKKGYNKYGFTINTSHRHPMYNEEKAKGAKFSQHIFGRAVDISIKDINKDMTADQRDKKIVLEIMEKIVANKGGLGKYPGTMAVHFDCRGHRARWDHQ